MVKLLRTPFVVLVVALALALVACDSSGDGTTTTGAPGSTSGSTLPGETTTTEAPVTSLPPDAVPGETSPSIPPEVEAEMRSEIGTLILDVEESRALPFLEIPTVTILDEAEFTARVNAQLQEDIDSEELAVAEALLKLVGMLEPDDDYEAMLVALFTEQVAGFYDPVTKELVVPVSVDGITPLQEVVIVHELIHALTDQHFDFGDEYERTVEEGVRDDASAMLASFEGDATYQQFLYLESLDPAAAAAAALEALQIDRSVLEASPRWMQRDLAFPYEQGLRFTDFLIDEGGLKAVDESYLSPPISTEQILDPNKYLRDELPLDLEPLTVTLAGWDLADEASWGEWGTRMMLLEVLSPETVIPLFQTTEAGGRHDLMIPVSPDQNWDRDPSELGVEVVAAAVTPGEGDPRGRMIVVGDASFTDAQTIQANPTNLTFLANALDWLAQDESLIRIRSKDRTPPALVFESDLSRTLLKWGNLIGMPLLFVLLALVRVTGRRRRAHARWGEVIS